jgi:hypothetical protein
MSMDMDIKIIKKKLIHFSRIYICVQYSSMYTWICICIYVYRYVYLKIKNHVVVLACTLSTQEVEGGSQLGGQPRLYSESLPHINKTKP